jgi:hypothetical protein
MFANFTDSHASDSGAAGREGRAILGAQAKPLYSQMTLSRKPFGIGHMFIYTFLLRMTDTMTSHNIDPSSWDILYVHTHTHTHTHTCMCVYIYIYIHIYIHTHTHTYIHTHTHTYRQTYINTYTHTYIYIHTHTHIYIYIHTHTHTHTTQPYDGLNTAKTCSCVFLNK